MCIFDHCDLQILQTDAILRICALDICDAIARNVYTSIVHVFAVIGIWI